jgi:hypothetical protein
MSLKDINTILIKLYTAILTISFAPITKQTLAAQ